MSPLGQLRQDVGRPTVYELAMADCGLHELDRMLTNTGWAVACDASPADPQGSGAVAYRRDLTNRARPSRRRFVLAHTRVSP